jgi:hypothetical protein
MNNENYTDKTRKQKLVKIQKTQNAKTQTTKKTLNLNVD